MIFRREPNGIAVAIPPREGLDRIRRIRGLEPGTQDRPIADTFVGRAVEGFHGRTWARHAEGRVAACSDSPARVEHVLAQHDILTWDVLLVRAAAIVATDDAAVGRRSLRPIDPLFVECELFRWMITRWQSRDERGDLSGLRVDDHNAGAVILPRGMCRLIGVRREQPPSLKATLERDIDRRPCSLKARAGRIWLAKGTSD